MKDLKKNKKRVWKVIYMILVLACLGCIGGMLMYLNQDEDVVPEVEVQQQNVEEVISEDVVLEETELAELPIDFASLWEINPEIYAWIEIPGTNVNYPIAQHEEEDQSYYLTRDIYGKDSSAGTIYTEYYNNKHFQDPHTIIYGHNMRNGSMFHNLRYFSEREYFEEHEDLYIYMPDKILKYQIITCYEFDDRHLLAAYDCMDEEAFADYLEEIMNPRSMYTMVREGCELTTEDKLVTLSTCVANKPNNRRLLQAVLLEEIEAEYKGAVDGTQSEEAN